MHDMTDLTSVYQTVSSGGAGAVGLPIGLVVDQAQLNGVSVGDYMAANSITDPLNVPGQPLVQGTSGDRPTLQSDYSAEINGTDHFDMNFAGAAGPSDCSVFMAVKTTADARVLWRSAIMTEYFGYWNGGLTQNTSLNAGSPVDYVDGVAVSPANSSGLSSAITDGNWHGYEARSCDLSGFAILTSLYAGFQFAGNTGPRMAIVPTTVADANRSLFESWVVEGLT